jgi:hypothetical protein
VVAVVDVVVLVVVSVVEVVVVAVVAVVEVVVVSVVGVVVVVDEVVVSVVVVAVVAVVAVVDVVLVAVVDVVVAVVDVVVLVVVSVVELAVVVVAVVVVLVVADVLVVVVGCSVVLVDDVVDDDVPSVVVVTGNGQVGCGCGLQTSTSLFESTRGGLSVDCATTWIPQMPGLPFFPRSTRIAVSGPHFASVPEGIFGFRNPSLHLPDFLTFSFLKSAAVHGPPAWLRQICRLKTQELFAVLTPSWSQLGSQSLHSTLPPFSLPGNPSNSARHWVVSSWITLRAEAGTAVPSIVPTRTSTMLRQTDPSAFVMVPPESGTAVPALRAGRQYLMRGETHRGLRGAAASVPRALVVPRERGAESGTIWASPGRSRQDVITRLTSPSR